jgi:hypothetical protein
MATRSFEFGVRYLRKMVLNFRPCADAIHVHLCSLCLCDLHEESLNAVMSET